jgi:hypothetical protein
MATFDALVNGLRKAESELKAQLAGLQAAIASLSDGQDVGNGRRRGRPLGSKNKGAEKGIIIVSGKRKRKRSKLSAKGRAAIAAAQKARWAKIKAAKKTSAKA